MRAFLRKFEMLLRIEQLPKKTDHAWACVGANFEAWPVASSRQTKWGALTLKEGGGDIDNYQCNFNDVHMWIENVHRYTLAIGIGFNIRQ